MQDVYVVDNFDGNVVLSDGTVVPIQDLVQDQKMVWVLYENGEFVEEVLDFYGALRMASKARIPTDLVAMQYLKEVTNGIPPVREGIYFDVETDEKGRFVCAAVLKEGHTNVKIVYDVRTLLKLLKGKDIMGHYITWFDLPQVLWREAIVENMPEYMYSVPISKNYRAYNVRGSVIYDSATYLALAWGQKSKTLYRVALELADMGYDVDADLARNVAEQKMKNDFDDSKAGEDVLLTSQVFEALKIHQALHDVYELAGASLTKAAMTGKLVDRLRKYVMYNVLLDAGVLPVSEPTRGPGGDARPNVYKYARAGFYTDVYVYDIKNAYPTTVINDKGQTLYWYMPGDLQALEQKLIDKADEYADIKPTRNLFKLLANSVIGKLADSDFIKRKPIVHRVTVERVYRFITDLIKRAGCSDRIIWGNTDGFATVGPCSVPEYANGYRIKQEHLDYMVVYHVNKHIDVSGRKVSLHGFWYPQSTDPIVLDVLYAKVKQILAKGPETARQFVMAPRAMIDINKLIAEVPDYYKAYIESDRSDRYVVQYDDRELKDLLGKYLDQFELAVLKGGSDE